jgi:hypothetical protein
LTGMGAGAANWGNGTGAGRNGNSVIEESRT